MRLAERRRHGVLVAVLLATGKRGLAGVRAQGGRSRGQQQVGAVGAVGEQHQHGAATADSGCDTQRARKELPRRSAPSILATTGASQSGSRSSRHETQARAAHAGRRPSVWLTRRSANPTRASSCGRSGPTTNLSASCGSTGPVPYDGHSSARKQAPQAGFLAWQTRRPW